MANKMIKGTKGTMFIMVMVISMLMIFVAVAAANMLMQDAHLVRHIEYSTQALYLAEAGISDALAILRANFGAKNLSGNFPSKWVDNPYGKFDVDITESDGRVLLSSTGTAGGVSRTVKLEVRNNVPSALYFMLSSGNNLNLKAHTHMAAVINGNLHANGIMQLYAKNDGSITTGGCGSACCDGSISHSNSQDIVIITQGSGIVTLGGTNTKDALPVTFPQFDYAYYESVTDDDDLYSGDTEFTGAELTPANGIVYVKGTAEFYGTCTLDGGIVADSIIVHGSLTQSKSGTRNVIISKTGDIWVKGSLQTGEALVYAQNDFWVREDGGTVNISGTLIAGRNMELWDKKTAITYNHKLVLPDGLLLGGPDDEVLEIVSWNR